MKYKFWGLVIIGIMFFSSNAEAKTYKVQAEALTPISTTKKMGEYITVRVPEQKNIGTDLYLEPDSMIRAKVVKIQPAQRAKRSGYLETVVIAYSLPSANNTAVNVYEKQISMKVKEFSPKDYKGMAESAATMAVSYAFNVPFLSQGVAAAKGAIKPEEGESRLVSAGKSAYNSTPISYINKGKEFEASRGDKLTLIFKIDNPEEEDAQKEDSEKEIAQPAP